MSLRHLPLALLLALGGLARADTLSFSATGYTATEDAGAVVLTVSRTGTGGGTASVQFATSDNSAHAGTDYSTTNGTITWEDGDTADKSISVLLSDDQTVEGTENFTVTLANASGATLGNPASATVTLTDIEPGRIAFTTTTYTATENDGSATITVSRTNGTTGAASIAYNTGSGSASPENDYTETSGSLSWADGEGGEKSFTVPLINDDEVEAAETLSLHIGTFSNPATGTYQEAQLTIINTDIAVEFSQETFTGDEGDNWIWITVNRLGGGFGEVSVQYSATAESADPEEDYVADTAQGTLHWPAGVAEPETIYLQLVDDEIAESDETLTFTLATPSGASLGELATTTVTIANDDNDFSSLLEHLSPEQEGVRQPPVINLSSDSPLSPETAIIDLINELEVVQEGRFLFSQDSANGVLSSSVATNSRISLHPVRVETRLADEASGGLYLSDSGEVRIATSDGTAIVCLPASASLPALYAAAEELGLAEIIVDNHGALVIPANTGSAPLEPNEDGELVIPASWFDRYVARPELFDRPAPTGAVSGIDVTPNPTAPGTILVTHRYSIAGQTREQILYPALANWDEIEQALRQSPEYREFTQGLDGTIYIELASNSFRFLPDYQVERQATPTSGAIEFHSIDDLNGDGIEDFEILYANGDRQRLYRLQ